jgi:hypothetical protein
VIDLVKVGIQYYVLKIPVSVVRFHLWPPIARLAAQQQTMRPTWWLCASRKTTRSPTRTDKRQRLQRNRESANLHALTKHHMDPVSRHYGPSVSAFIVLPIIGAFFIDLLDTGVIQFFMYQIND